MVEKRRLFQSLDRKSVENKNRNVEKEIQKKIQFDFPQNLIFFFFEERRTGKFEARQKN